VIDRKGGFMSLLDEQLEAMKSALEAAGGMVGLNPDSPEWIKREFLKQIWECEDCRKAMLNGGLVKPH
jgi:hypothetical protein